MSDAVKLPTVEELKKLPFRALVAFAERCARRVLPVYEGWKDAKPRDIEALETSVCLSEGIAACTTGRDAEAAERAEYLGKQFPSPAAI